MHTEGMGTLVTCGGVKSGALRVTAVEAADCIPSTRTSGFNPFVKSRDTQSTADNPLSTAHRKEPCVYKSGMFQELGEIRM